MMLEWNQCVAVDGDKLIIYDIYNTAEEDACDKGLQ